MEDNQEKFMVVASGVKDGNPYSNLKKIVSGTKRNTNEPFAFLDDNSFEKVNEKLTLGTIIIYERKRIENKFTSKTS